MPDTTTHLMQPILLTPTEHSEVLGGLMGELYRLQGYRDTGEITEYGLQRIERLTELFTKINAAYLPEVL